MRTADSVLLTCWPPAPPARMVSMLQVGVVDLDVDLLGLGQHRDGRGRGVDAALASVAGTRCTRCTPLSNFSRAKTPRPLIAATISL